MPACQKRPYPTPTSAARVLRRIRTEHPARGEVGIHPCRTCHAWHLTSDRAAAGKRWTATALAKLARRGRGYEPLPG